MSLNEINTLLSRAALPGTSAASESQLLAHLTIGGIFMVLISHFQSETAFKWFDSCTDPSFWGVCAAAYRSC